MRIFPSVFRRTLQGQAKPAETDSRAAALHSFAGLSFWCAIVKGEWWSLLHSRDVPDSLLAVKATETENCGNSIMRDQ